MQTDVPNERILCFLKACDHTIYIATTRYTTITTTTIATTTTTTIHTNKYFTVVIIDNSEFL